MSKVKPFPRFDRLERAGITTLRTDRDGAIWLELDGRGVRIVDWRHPPAFLAREGATRARVPRPAP